MDEVRLKRFVNDRYGNFPGTVQDEMVGVFRDFLERIRSNPGGHLVIRTERDTSRTTKGIPGQCGSSQFIPGSEKSWLIGTITGKPDLLGGETLSLVLENVLEGGECVCIPNHDYGIEYAAMSVDQGVVSKITQKYLDISVLLLKSVQKNWDRLKEEWRGYRGTQAELLIGDREIGAWLENPRNDIPKLFELISLLGWTLDDSKQYQEWMKRQGRLDEFELRYQAEGPHIEAVAELLKAIETDPALSSYGARLRQDLRLSKL